MKCFLCVQRKAKRFCPANNSHICSQCCGEKRVLEIDCPESCEFLKAGRSQEGRQAAELFFRTPDPHERDRRLRIVEEFDDVIGILQLVIAQERWTARDLTDSDLIEALDCLLKTLRTEESGILYETTSTNLQADALRRQLGEEVQSLRYPKDEDAGRLLLGDAIQCLEFFRGVAKTYQEPGVSSLSLVDFLARQIPRDEKNRLYRSSLIIPG